jgi:hypothetical protein
MPGPPTDEVCDGKDNDCDQQIDEGFPLGAACTSGQGACAAAGVVVCDGMGRHEVQRGPGQPGPEICGNALDENCDGTLERRLRRRRPRQPLRRARGRRGHRPDATRTRDDDGVLDGDEPEYALDTDGDGLINALDPDSDNDGLLDGTELGLGCDHPHTIAAMGAAVADADPATTTDPLTADSDGGGATDGSEDADLDGQVDAGETDPSDQLDDDSVADTDMRRPRRRARGDARVEPERRGQRRRRPARRLRAEPEHRHRHATGS